MVSQKDLDLFLARKTANLLRENFPMQEVSNLLVVRWGKKWRTKVAHIKPFKEKEFGTAIEVNELLQDESVPEYVLDATIMHELVHYFHGFGSNKERKHRHPHRGGVVDNELEKKGWKELVDNGDKWLNENWPSLIVKHGVKGRKKSLFKFKFF